MPFDPVIDDLVWQFVTSLAFIVPGVVAIAYLYRRKEFPRASRLLWGVLFVFIAVVNTLSIEQLASHVDTWLKVAPWQYAQSVIWLKSTCQMLGRLIPFVFGAVGAGLMANSLIQRP